jgi:hypothetical protein
MVPTEKEAEWTPETVWMIWRRGKSLSPAGIQTPDCPVCSVTVMLSVLHKLKYIGVKPTITARRVIWPLRYF